MLNVEKLRTSPNTVPGGKTTYYINNFCEVINGQLVKYVFAGNLRVARIQGGQVTYYHKDHLGSSTVMTDASGNVVESTAYLPYGGQRGTAEIAGSGYTFTDQEWEDETGLYNYDARLYDPVVGGVLSADPFVQAPYDPHTFNRFQYCRSNPLLYVDPSGYVHEIGPDENGNPTIDEEYQGPNRVDHKTYWEKQPDGKVVKREVLYGLTFINGYFQPDNLKYITITRYYHIPIPKSQYEDTARKLNDFLISIGGTPIGPRNARVDRDVAKANVIGSGGVKWFKEQVETNGEWDYKQNGWLYEDYGNFNFGAAGAALGFSAQVLLRGAGAYQVFSKTSSPGWGNPLGGSPYGDDPRDQEMITRGIDYFFRTGL